MPNIKQKVFLTIIYFWMADLCHYILPVEERTLTVKPEERCGVITRCH